MIRISYAFIGINEYVISLREISMNEEVIALLERLVLVNENVLDTLCDIKSELATINEELDWTKEHSHSKMHLDKLEEIESKLFEIEINLPA